MVFHMNRVHPGTDEDQASVSERFPMATTQKNSFSPMLGLFFTSNIVEATGTDGQAGCAVTDTTQAFILG